MGHHIFEFHDRALRMHDIDVALVNHFLVLGAQRLGNEELSSSLRRWEWCGPGVWLNAEERILAFARAEVFAAAKSALAALGPVVSGQYIREIYPNLSGAEGRDAALILNELCKLEALVTPSA